MPKRYVQNVSPSSVDLQLDNGLHISKLEQQQLQIINGGNKSPRMTSNQNDSQSCI